MGACLNGIVCICSAREETPLCGVFAAWAPRGWGFPVGLPHGLHFGCCIYSHHTTPGLEVEQHYCIHRIGIISLRFTHSPSLSVDKVCVPSHNTKKNRPWWPEHK
jgi:hypothetical protein